MAKLTIWAMLTNPLNTNEGLFDLLTLPEDINTQDCIDTIKMRCGEFEVLYPNFGFFRDAIGLWGKKYYDTFEKWASVLNAEYNPLENYDRNETYSGTHGEGRAHDNNISTATTELKAANYTESTGNSSTENSRVPFTNTGSEPYLPDTKSVTSMTSKDTRQLTHLYNDSNIGQERIYSGDEHTTRIHGNIGVISSQLMVQAELDLRRFVLLDQIADLFVKEFCICVY